jgi:6-hydroxycyclohex-1-ene-1-carbonyl-CoA dehydrogenase
VSESARNWGCASHSWKIFECSGSPGGQETAFGLLGYAGTLLLIGFTLSKVALRLSNAMAFDATIQGTWGCRPELYPDALRLVTEGRVTLKPFIEAHALCDGPAVIQQVAEHGIHRRVVLKPGSTRAAGGPSED